MLKNKERESWGKVDHLCSFLSASVKHVWQGLYLLWGFGSIQIKYSLPSLTTGSPMALSSPTDGSAFLLLLNFWLSHHFLFSLLVLWTLQIIRILNSLHWTLWHGFCCPDQTLDNTAILINTVWNWHTYRQIGRKRSYILWQEFAL